MSTPAQIGKNEWRAAIAAARAANADIRAALRRAMREGNSAVRAAIGSAALALSENEAALNRLDEIGRKARRGGS